MLHAARIVIATVLLIAVSILGVWSSLIGMEMVDRLNKQLPTEEQFGVLGWGPFKRRKFFEKYKQVFPNDPLWRRLWLFTGIATACLLGIALDLGFFW